MDFSIKIENNNYAALKSLKKCEQKITERVRQLQKSSKTKVIVRKAQSQIQTLTTKMHESIIKKKTFRIRFITASKTDKKNEPGKRMRTL